MPLIDGKFVDLELPTKHAKVLLSPGYTINKATNIKRHILPGESFNQADLIPWMYRALYGGRNGAKDWSMAAVAIEIALRKRTRFLFTREIQLTIKHSAHQLLVDTIYRLGYGAYFDITDYKITCKLNDSFFIFMGLKDLNKDNVKSIEGINICVVCEAQDLTKESFEVLDPTIRQDGGEIWFQFNPQYEEDFVYQFCVTDPPEEMIAELVTYLDHPYNSDRTLNQANRAKLKAPEDYKHIWLGGCKGTGGKFYPGVNSDVHFKPQECNEQLFNFEFLSKHAQLFMAIDPHTVYYPACIWVARIMLGKEMFYVIYNEFPTKSFFDGEYYYKVRKELACTLTMNDLSSAFKIFDCTVGDIQTGAKVVERYVDTRFAKASGAASWSTNTEGLITEWSKPSNGNIILKQPEECIIDVQKMSVREVIKYNEDIPVCSINQPRLLVLPHCSNVKDTLLNHKNNRENTGEDETRKDFSDALRICFAGMSKVKWEDPSKIDEEVPFLLNSTKTNVGYSLVGAK